MTNPAENLEVKKGIGKLESGDFVSDEVLALANTARTPR